MLVRQFLSGRTRMAAVNGVSVAGLRNCFTASLIFIWACCCGTLWGADPTPQALRQQIGEHLAAGEFGPARAKAAALAAGQDRDGQLARIANAQAAAGAQPGAIASLASMQSSAAREQTARQLRQSNSAQNSPNGAARGGGVQADFDSLIELITSTVEPESWEEGGSGKGTISGFDGGVYVDPAGTLHKLTPRTDSSLDSVHNRAKDLDNAALKKGDVRRTSSLRKISLPRLEKAVQLLHAQGKSPDEAMQALAGITKIQYVLLYPETGDVVLAGPAGDWVADAEGRRTNPTSHQPVMLLDDLVVTLRAAMSKEGKFGCSITPTKEGLAEAQEVANRWAKQPLKAGQKGKWLEELRSAVGLQDIEIYGIDPRTHAAQVIVEADYRMKLVGMGLEEGVLGVDSYLKLLDLKTDAEPPSMSVLRWWFTLNYKHLTKSENGQAFELHGPGVKVLSENELLTELGDRLHTGKSDIPNHLFAESFTKQFGPLSAKYPIYADLRNVFDLALATALVQSHDLTGQANWQPSHFGPEGDYQPELGIAPTKVDTIINHRQLNQKQIVAGVSGGVTVEPRSVVSPDKIDQDTYGALPATHTGSKPKQLSQTAWWWD